MCGRLVNLDTVARVLAEYYHLKTETQLAALDEALSKVPAVSVGGGHKKDHVADPGKMVEDLISRRAAIDALEEWHDEAITNRLNNLPSAQPVAKDINVPVNDCISRQAAIDAFLTELTKRERKNFLHTWSTVEVKYFVADMFEKLPSAQRWIPWDSGKFPKESGTYTVTAYDGATKRVTYAKYQKRLKRWELTGARAYWRVLAWMEKPEPWKGERDG